MEDWNEEYINNLKEVDKHIKDSKIKLNYEFITQHYFEMYEVALNAGTIMPYRFNTIGLAYTGKEHNKPTRFKNFDPKVKERLVKSYAKRNELQYKYKDPQVDSKEKYEKFLDKEIYDFIEEFPQYKDIILEEIWIG